MNHLRKRNISQHETSFEAAKKKGQSRVWATERENKLQERITSTLRDEKERNVRLQPLDPNIRFLYRAVHRVNFK